MERGLQALAALGRAAGDSKTTQQAQRAGRMVPAADASTYRIYLLIRLSFWVFGLIID